MDEQILQKISIYREYNQSMEKFKQNHFASNRYYITILAVILLIIISSNQVFGASSLLFSFIFSFFGLCISIMWLINQDNYSQLIKIKLAKVLEEMEKELPLKPYTIEHEAITEYKNRKRFYSYEQLQNFMAFTVALIFTIIFFSKIMPFFYMVKSLVG